MQLTPIFIVNEPSQWTFNYLEIRSKAALSKLSSMNEYITRNGSQCLRGKVCYYDEQLFCWGVMSLAHANAGDLVIAIQARPSGICSELIFCLPGHTLSRFSFECYERYLLKY